MPATLKRSLSLPLVTFYGLGTILGAGIYVLVGAVAAVAGPWTPCAFLLAAVIAAVTALSYAELVRRMPLCAAEASYVDAAFGRPLLTLGVGLAVVLAGVVSSATIANGFAAYLDVFVSAPRAVALCALIGTLTLIAAVGIEASVWAASLMTLIEIAGLGVAYHAKPVVAQAAPARIDHTDLTTLLYMQGYARDEFAGA